MGLRTVVQVCGSPSPVNRRFEHALASTGVRVVPLAVPPDDAVLDAALDRVVSAYGVPHRIVTTVEPYLEPVARQRVRLGVRGLAPEAARHFRDKEAMKAALRRARIPVAPSRLVHTLLDAHAFAAEAGYPVVLKPPAGVSAAATVRVEGRAALDALWPTLPRPLLAEGFVSGTEHSLEVWRVGDRTVPLGATRYAPTPLEVTEHPDRQWVVFLPQRTRAFDAPARLVGRALDALGMDDGLAHAEWFWRPDGTIAIGEIGARPPGASFLDLHGHACGVDLYRVWARLVVDGVLEGPPERRYAVAGVYLRGVGSGKVVSVEGLGAAQEAIGAHVVEARLPVPGRPRALGYEGDGLVIVRHTDDAVVEAAVATILQTVKIRYA